MIDYLVEKTHLNWLAFRKEMISFMRTLDFKVYMDFDWTFGSSRRFSLIGAVEISRLAQLMECFCIYGQNVTEIETLNYKGLYFDNEFNFIGLIMSPKQQNLSIDQSVLNQAKDSQLLYELQSFGFENNLTGLALMDFLSAKPLWDCIEFVESDLLNISHYELLFKKFENTHNEHKRYYLEFKNNRKSYTFNFDKYNNSIEIFSRIYFREIEIIAGLIKKKSITIHDAGTNVAHFPLLLSSLKEDELFGKEFTDIIASDFAWTGEDCVQEIARKNFNYSNIKFIRLDLLKDINSMPCTDVVILNDVLEHLPDEEQALSVLIELWDKAKVLLIVHVPFEECPNPSWDHHITFNEEKLKNWASHLKGSRYLSERYYETNKSTMANNGYLIAIKS